MGDATHGGACVKEAKEFIRDSVSEKMGRKGKTQKHSAAEIAGKHKAAKEKAGGAGGGAEKRKQAGAKASVACKICMTVQPNIKSMEAHFDSKHAKLKWADEKAGYEAMFAAAKSGDK